MSQDQYEPQMMSLVRKIVRPYFVCADIGAHEGEFSCVLSDLSCQVHAFEILRKNVEILTQKLSSKNHVIINHMAVSDHDGPINVFRGVTSFEFNIIGHDFRGNVSPIECQIQATSLDSYMTGKGRLDFVKMDVEGAEHLVLKGMQGCLQKLRPILLVEFHDETGWEGRHFLGDNGYLLKSVLELNSPWIDLDKHPRIYHCLCVPSENAQRMGQVLI